MKHTTVAVGPFIPLTQCLQMSSGLGEFLTYPQSFLLGQRRLFFLLRLLLQLVVAHGDDGQDLQGLSF